jgi:hypothetical protein
MAFSKLLTIPSYITCTQDINVPTIECELTILCLRYLTFPCFSSEPVGDQILNQWAIDGNLAFEDYAIANWFRHFNAFISAGEAFLQHGTNISGHLEELTIAVKDFTTQFDEEDWFDPHNTVNECCEAAGPFKNHDMYENLVAVSSHIYRHQKKDSDARREVSIKSLAQALKRNRVVLEELPLKLGLQELELYRRLNDDKNPYRCPYISCHHFSIGFSNAKARKRHVNIHDRPFCCEVSECVGGNGFANSIDLVM